MDQACPDARHFVGNYTRTHAAATNGQTAMHFPAIDRTGQGHNKIWIIIVQVRLSVAEVDHIMNGLAQHPNRIFL